MTGIEKESMKNNPMTMVSQRIVEKSEDHQRKESDREEEREITRGEDVVCMEQRRKEKERREGTTKKRKEREKPKRPRIELNGTMRVMSV